MNMLRCYLDMLPEAWRIRRVWPLFLACVLILILSYFIDYLEAN